MPPFASFYDDDDDDGSRGGGGGNCSHFVSKKFSSNLWHWRKRKRTRSGTNALLCFLFLVS